MSDIGAWLESAGKTLLSEARIGDTSAQADQLLREHEAIELKCRVKQKLQFKRKRCSKKLIRFTKN